MGQIEKGNGYDAKTMLQKIVTKECNRILNEGISLTGISITLNDLRNSSRAQVRQQACKNLEIDWYDFQRELYNGGHPTNGDPQEGIAL